MKFRSRRADDKPEHLVCGVWRNTHWSQQVLKEYPEIEILCLFCFNPEGVETALTPTVAEFVRDVTGGN